MCEFTVLKKSGLSSEKIGEDVIFFSYSESGHAKLMDILGRTKAEIPNGFVYEINMLENRHDITLIESDLVPLFVSLMEKIETGSLEEKKQHANALISRIQEIIKE
jgi:predicted RNA-binding protein